MSVQFILKGYPRLSETFIAQEILALERRGLEINIASLRHPTDDRVHPIHRDIRAEALYLPEYLYQEPERVRDARAAAQRLPGYQTAYACFRADLKRDPTRNRIRRFGQACVLAHELPEGVTRLHAHFLHTPASVARYAAMMTGLPWSCSAHAKDIWTTPEWEMREKLADLDWLVTCTAAGADFLAGLAPGKDTVSLVYHGIDFSRFPPPPDARPGLDGQAAPVTILSVGRAVGKKGYDDLLTALSRLPADINWRFRHIGGGPLLETLKAQAQQLGIAAHVEWYGARAQEDVLDALRHADIFVLASKTTDDGDRDGLPNVLMEAQSQCLPVLSTMVSGIPELIHHDTTGLLVPPGDALAIATALERLIRNPSERRRLADAGLDRVHSQFSMDHGADTLAARFLRDPQSAAA